MPVDILKLIAFVMADLPDLEGIISAIIKAVADEKAATTFVARQAASEGVQRAVAAFADKVKAQVEAYQAPKA